MKPVIKKTLVTILLAGATASGSLFLDGSANAIPAPPRPPVPSPQPPPPPPPLLPPHEMGVDLDVSPIYQNQQGQPDPELRNGSGDTLSEYGCTLTCYTMMINFELKGLDIHKKNEDGSQGELLQYTPSDLDKMLDEGYTRIKNGKETNYPGWVLKDKEEMMVPGVLWTKVIEDVKEQSGVDLTNKIKKNQLTWSPWFVYANGRLTAWGYDRIWTALRYGYPVMVRVNNDEHSVLITSYHPGSDYENWYITRGRFDIKDPWLNDPVKSGFSCKKVFV